MTSAHAWLPLTYLAISACMGARDAQSCSCTLYMSVEADHLNLGTWVVAYPEDYNDTLLRDGCAVCHKLLLHFVSIPGTQLEALESAYARKAEEESQRYHQSIEDRLSEYQRDLEARYKEQLKTEMSLFQVKEVAKARQEEREKCRQEAAREKEEAHLKLQRKLDELRRNELQLKEQYCRKEQVGQSTLGILICRIV